MLAADFFTTEVLSWNGLVTYYTLFLIELRSRAVDVCGTTVSRNAEWIRQVARQLVDSARNYSGRFGGLRQERAAVESAAEVFEDG